MQTKLKRSLSLLLALGMVMGLLCGNAWAVETGKKESQPQRTEQVEESSPETMDSTTSGTCGDHLTWKYARNRKLLKIYGTGEMWSYDADSIPWKGLKIEDVSIEEGVTSIGAYAFYGCSDLIFVDIPRTATKIGKSAFENCGALESIFYRGIQIEWNKISISDGNAPLKTATIDYISTSGKCGENVTWKLEGTTLTFSGTGEMKNEIHGLGDVSPWTKLQFDTVIVEKGITSIDRAVFYNCSGLTSVTIPDYSGSVVKTKI